jgi:hypothetical protein
MIDGVLNTKRCIVISVAGIAFVLPKDAVGDSLAVEALIADLQAQTSHA